MQRREALRATAVFSATLIAFSAASAQPRKRVPIVMATGTDQVSLGLAASLRQPGADVTGLPTITSELAGKRFELLRQFVPN